MKIRVILNEAAGSLTGAAPTSGVERVSAAFQKAGVDANVRSVDHEALKEALQDAERSDADAVVVGGGDGTLGTGAAALLGSTKPMGILPLGTRNHFARDVGIPSDLEEAVAVIAAGQVRTIDLGEVNNQYFVNNSSIGLYPIAVEERDELRHQNGGGKTLAMLRAMADVMRRFPLLNVTLAVDGRASSIRTPFVFVGNNRYEMSFFALGQRSDLEGGELGVYLTRHTGRLGVLRLALMALIGRMRQDRDFRYFTVRQVEIRSRRRFLRVSLDGEVVRMESPIRFTIHPKALRILAPPPKETPAGTEASA